MHASYILAAAEEEMSYSRISLRFTFFFQAGRQGGWVCCLLALLEDPSSIFVNLLVKASQYIWMNRPHTFIIDERGAGN